MNRVVVFRVADDLAFWVNSLAKQTDSTLRHVEDVLCAQHRSASVDSPAAIVPYELHSVGETIKLVIMAYDRLCWMAHVPSGFEVVCDILPLPDPGSGENRHPPAPSE
jgi:hypothetical protein